MIIPLRHSRVGSARVSRLWAAPAQVSRAGQDRFDQRLGWLIEAIAAGTHSFKLLVGGILVLLLALIHLYVAGNLLPTLAAALLVWGVVMTRRWKRTQATLADLREDVLCRERAAHDRAHAQQLMEWRRYDLQIITCTSIAALERLAAERATAISGSMVSVQLSGGGPAIDDWPAGERALRLAIEGGDDHGMLVVFRERDQLDQAQRAALERLAMLVGIQAAQLRGAAQLARQQTALMTLWEVAGVLRLAPDSQDATREACCRIAAALDLDWLALLGHGEHQALATLLIARGCARRPAPRLNGAQVRVAAEALRAGRPLVRSEDARSLICLPIGLPGGAPLVLAARGDGADAATQVLLLLFGEMILDRLGRPTTDDRRPTNDERPTTNDQRQGDKETGRQGDRENTAHTMQRTTDNGQRTTDNGQRTTDNGQLRNTQHAIRNTQHATRNTQRVSGAAQ